MANFYSIANVDDPAAIPRPVMSTDGKQYVAPIAKVFKWTFDLTSNGGTYWGEFRRASGGIFVSPYYLTFPSSITWSYDNTTTSTRTILTHHTQLQYQWSKTGNYPSATRYIRFLSIFGLTRGQLSISNPFDESITIGDPLDSGDGPVDSRCVGDWRAATIDGGTGTYYYYGMPTFPLQIYGRAETLNNYPNATVEIIAP